MGEIKALGCAADFCHICQEIKILCSDKWLQFDQSSQNVQISLKGCGVMSKSMWEGQWILGYSK